jgi:hypothetical protein
MTHRYDADEIGGADALDAAPGPAVAAAPDWWLPRLGRRLTTNVALGLPPVLAPALVFVPIGMLLGPLGLGVLTTTVLSFLAPVVATGVAALGVFVGLALSRRAGRGGWLFAAANIESGATILIVGLSCWWLLHAWDFPTSSPAILALVLGVAAAASSAGYEDTAAGSPTSIAARIANLDDVLPIMVGGLAIAVVHAASWLEAAALVGVTCVLGAVVGIVGTLLIERAHSDAERGLFVIGLLALAGGSASYLGLSPLVTGLVAGVVWKWGPGRVDAIVRQDVRQYQHPLVVLVLLVAGASVRPSVEALWLLAPFVLFRVTGKLAGGWLATRVAAGLAPGDLGAHLMAPGLIGIAFALSTVQVLGTGGMPVLTAIVAGTLVSEVVALSVAPSAAVGPVEESR